MLQFFEKICNVILWIENCYCYWVIFCQEWPLPWKPQSTSSGDFQMGEGGNWLWTNDIVVDIVVDVKSTTIDDDDKSCDVSGQSWSVRLAIGKRWWSSYKLLRTTVGPETGISYCHKNWIYRNNRITLLPCKKTRISSMSMNIVINATSFGFQRITKFRPELNFCLPIFPIFRLAYKYSCLSVCQTCLSTFF